VRTAFNAAAIVMALADGRAAIGTGSGFDHCGFGSLGAVVLCTASTAGRQFESANSKFLAASTLSGTR